MERIGVRELRQNASRYLDRVKAGESIEVTERGRLVAVLGPPTSDHEVKERLVREGTLIPGMGPLRLPRRTRSSTSTEGALDELREDR